MKLETTGPARQSSSFASLIQTVIDVRIVFFHPALRLSQFSETRFSIKAVGVARRKHPPSNASQVGMRHHNFDQPFAQALIVELAEHEYVRQVSKRRRVGDDAGKSDLAMTLVESERKRLLDRAFHNIERDARSPIGVGQKLVDEDDIQPRRIGADCILASRPLVFHIQAWLEHRPQMGLGSCAASASSTAITIIFDSAS